MALLLQAVLLGDAPFLSASHERQNQTAELARDFALGGANAWLRPAAPFSHAQDPARARTVIRFEFPFIGLLGWPFYRAFGTHAWIERLVVGLLAAASVLLLHRLALRLSTPTGALAAALIWTASPLVLHYGAVPMPDIVAVTGLLAALRLALDGRNLASAMAQAAALLAKPTVLPFCLPPFLLQRSWPRRLAWAAAALLPLIAWNALASGDPPGSLSLLRTGATAPNGFPGDLFQFTFYWRSLAYLVVFGLGPAGAALVLLGLPSAWRAAWFRGFVASSMASYILAPRFMWREPQYSLPVLAGLCLVAGMGTTPGQAWVRRSVPRRLAGGVALVLQLVTSTILVVDLKASRVPNFEDFAIAARILPPRARVLLVSPSYGASPAAWLGRNVLPMPPSDDPPEARLARLAGLGFSHLLFFENSLRAGPFSGARAWSSSWAAEARLLAHARASLELVHAGDRLLLFAIPGAALRPAASDRS
jgi:hypothetical protein